MLNHLKWRLSFLNVCVTYTIVVYFQGSTVLLCHFLLFLCVSVEQFSQIGSVQTLLLYICGLHVVIIERERGGER